MFGTVQCQSIGSDKRLASLRLKRLIRMKPCLILDLRKQSYLDDNWNISQRFGRHEWHQYPILYLTSLFKNFFQMNRTVVSPFSFFVKFHLYSRCFPNRHFTIVNKLLDLMLENVVLCVLIDNSFHSNLSYIYATCLQAYYSSKLRMLLSHLAWCPYYIIRHPR